MRRSLIPLVLLAGCSSSGGSTSTGSDAAIDGSAASDAAATADAPSDKTAACASTFGNALTNSFGRVDGTILAVVPPGYQGCAQPNSTHIVLQVTMNGAAYRMVINTDGLVDQLDAPLAGPAWGDGWHTDAQLDYVSTLHVASSAFTPPADVVALVTDQLELGAHVSVFGTSSGGVKADSAHLIHRNSANADGAIVIHPDTAPHYILFRFSNQSF
ncbi:MAG TPA: hypothetical protein VLB44_03630 [Kofleriaceae bacterium]|nr:hypothetical protein [Kofleriaceae bacterium]